MARFLVRLYRHHRFTEIDAGHIIEAAEIARCANIRAPWADVKRVPNPDASEYDGTINPGVTRVTFGKDTEQHR